MKRKKGLIVGILVFLIILTILIIFGFITYLFVISSEKSDLNNSSNKTIPSNPINLLKSKSYSVLDNSSEDSNMFLDSSFLNVSQVDYIESQIIQEGIDAFDENYINFILFGLGVDRLHNAIGFGNPIIEILVDNETWTSEIIANSPKTIKISSDNEDIKIILNKEEVVNGLLANDVSIFMKNSVVNGNTKIEIVAGNFELFAKGYLNLYNELYGNSTASD